MRTAMLQRWRWLLAALPVAAALCALPRASRGASPAPRAWWLDEPVATSWATLSDPDQPPYLRYLRECGSRVADRGLYLGHLNDPKRPKPGEKERDAARFFQANGLRWTTFFSVEGWDPAPAAVSRLAEELKRHVDLGADGVHLDLLNNPKSETGAAAAFGQLRDELHRYAASNGRACMVTGNTWLLDTPFTLQAARLADVAWVESYGRDELELLRLVQVARDLNDDQKPVWYHLQPDYDEDGRITGLANLPCSLYASCLFADGLFLGNYQYPVFVTTGPDKSEEFFGKRGKWRMVRTNPRWQGSVVRYSRFARRQAALTAGTTTEAPVLVAYRAEQVKEANALMLRLLKERVPFRVKVYGKEFFPPLTRADLGRSTALLSPDRSGGWHAGTRAFTEVDQFLRETRSERERFLTILGPEQVLGRVTVSGHKRFLHLKQTGYSEKTDSLRQTGALHITLFAPGVQRAFMISPDSETRTPLKLYRHGEQVTFDLAGLRHYALVVLE